MDSLFDRVDWTEAWVDCAVCGMPAETTKVFDLRGVGTRGQDIILHMEHYMCVQGHHYDMEVGEDDADMVQ